MTVNDAVMWIIAVRRKECAPMPDVCLAEAGFSGSAVQEVRRAWIGTLERG
jgi:hypothetical protein